MFNYLENARTGAGDGEVLHLSGKVLSVFLQRVPIGGGAAGEEESCAAGGERGAAAEETSDCLHLLLPGKGAGVPRTVSRYIYHYLDYTISELTRLIAKEWSELPEETKQPFHHRAA